MLIRKIICSAFLFIFLLSALYTTICGISNVTFLDVKESFAEEQINKHDLSENLGTRQTMLQKRNLLKKADRKTYLSSGEVATVTSIEEAIDFNKYPSKKVVATGYTAGYESTGKTEKHPQYGITYSGVTVKRDLYSTIAADLSVFPLGTILYIPNYGYGVVSDIGGAIKGNKIDLYFETVDAVYTEWGKREVDVYVIEEGNGKVTEEDLQVLNENEALQVFREQFTRKTSE